MGDANLGLGPSVSLSLNSMTEDRSSSVLVTTSILTAIATVAIWLKVYGCLFILRRRFGFEEWICVVNLASIVFFLFRYVYVEAVSKLIVFKYWYSS